ncbi:glycosyltransferase family 2 protein [Bizionia paragorgiae]|uniref:glycosyltransferase family 2 protein n=1 Tax=Bizionia paragorgiae TaxID=283786 RepID=UPI003A8F56C3
MMNNPLVSIIIPTFNRAHLISETLDSIMAQTYTNWECIIVDDGSTDNTSEVVRGYVEKDPRFQYQHRPKDRLPGGNAARNYGFEVSKGEYIQWFDSDDIMTKHFLICKINLLIKKTRLDVVFCGFETFGYKTFLLKEYKLDNSNCLENIFLNKRITLNTPSFLFKREVVKNLKFDENLTKAQDLDFVFRVLISKRCLLWDFVPLSLVRIRVHNSSITSIGKVTKKGFDSELLVLNRIETYFKNTSDETNLKLISVRRNNLLISVLRKRKYGLYFKGLWSNDTSFFVKIFLSSISIVHFFTNRGILLSKKILK